ncbi:MAG TPA: hypothetical protein VG125_30260, partial [Pirellulales bacterium]|nr:hypothetical protein [Pirellulales bacterium]
MRSVILTGACLLFLASAAGAEDTVTLFSGGNRQGRSRVTGEVVDYTGKQIIIRLADDREMKRPGQLVAAIETTWPVAKTQGDRLFEEHQFSAAREKYSAAIRSETRPWARRAILARIIACYRELNQLENAGKLFLALVREDPETPYFDEIPLAWQPTELGAALAQTAGQWLADESRTAGLIGASHLLSSLERQQALDRLSRLAQEKDARIASLAEAQAWRASIPTVKAEQLDNWERRVESFPDASRAGPYWVLGRALAQHGEPARAVLAFLHVPTVYPQVRPLAADSLRAAAALMEKLGDNSAALRLRQELVAAYPESPAAAEVKSTLETTAPGTGVPTASLETGSIEQTFLAGLRARRLFALAEERCRRRLGETGLSDAARIDLAVDLSRTLTEHALNEGQADREPLWRAASEAVQAPGLESIKGSRRLLLDVQQGLVRLTRGELARQEAELAGSDATSLEAARQELRAAIGLLQATLKEVARGLRQASQSRRAEAGDLNANELAALERNLAYQLARAFRNQGESYPAKSADHSNSLRQAVEQLQHLLGDSDPVAWQARLDEVVCLRLLEDFDAAAARIGKLSDSDLPAALVPAVKAEQIRLLLDQHRLDAALAAVEKMQAAGVDGTADLDYAFLEVSLAAWRAAASGHRPNDAAQWQNRAAELVSQIDERFGRYWSRRAEMLLAGSVTRGGHTQNLAILVRAAESFYRSGQFDKSLEAYDRAARQAREEKQGLAFDYAYTAAAIEQQRGR